MRRMLILLMLLTLALGGCPAPGEAPAPPLVGQVVFPAGLRTQADLNDIATAATVSLIDLATNSTMGTTLTDSQGRFSLTPTRNFRPVAGTLYYMEAVKGLYDNQVGADVARVRTIIRFDAGWTSLSAGSIIYLNESTTALSAMVGLKDGSATPIDASSLIAQLAVSTPDGELPDTLSPVTNCPVGEFATVRGLVTSALTQDVDPLAGISWNASTGLYSLNTGRGPIITALTPDTGAAGAEVTLTGARFEATPASNSVSFNGVRATVLTASATELHVRVPSGATTGLVVAETRNGQSNGMAFLVLSNVSGTFRGQ